MASKMNHRSLGMSQRVEAHDSLDDFPTPPWATRAICRFIAERCTATRLGELTAREPCANRGHMLRPLQEYFAGVDAFDVHDYGLGLPKRDFLFRMEPIEPVDWTIFNPPYRLAEDFIDRALESSRKGIAMVCRSAFLEGEERHRMIFSKRPPSWILQFSERVVMLKGRMVKSGAPDPSEDNPTRKAGTATATTALIWVHDMPAKKLFDWIGPCRADLERDGDYPAEPDGLAILHFPVRQF